MNIANFTVNMWVSALPGFFIYPKVIDNIIGEGQKLLHVNVLDRFVQLASWEMEEIIYVYLTVSYQCLSSVTPNSHRNGSFVFVQSFYFSAHLNW